MNQRPRRISRWLCGALAIFCLRVPPALAQVSAILSGTVTDPTSAVVAESAVTAKNIDTGAVRKTVTDGEGHYQFFSLPLGPYEIRVVKPGFSEEVRTGVHLM